MRIVCAWCDLVLEEGPGPASHGLCEGCAMLWEARIAATRRPARGCRKRPAPPARRPQPPAAQLAFW